MNVHINISIDIIHDAIVGSLEPSDFMSFTVAAGYVPTSLWRRRLLNLFRELGDYDDQVCFMPLIEGA